MVPMLTAFAPVVMVTRGRRNYPIPPEYQNVIMPPVENRMLPVLDKIPVTAPGVKYFKYPRRHSDCRGPELIHNTFMYKQYGIMVSARRDICGTRVLTQFVGTGRRRSA